MSREVRIVITLMLVASISSPLFLLSQQKDLVADSLLSMLSKTRSDTTRLRLRLELAKYFSGKENARITLTHALEAEKLAESLHKEKELGEAVNAVGNAYFYAGLLEESARYFTRYLEMKKISGNDFEKTMAYSNIAGIWVLKEDYDRADSLYKIVLKLLENISDEKILPRSEKIKSLSTLYNNMSIVYREKKQLDLAAFYNEKGIALCASVPELRKEWIRLVNNYSDLLSQKGKTEEAIVLLEAALDSSRKMNDRAMEAASHYSLVKVLEKKGDHAKALEHANKSLGLAITLDDPQSTQIIATIIYSIYKKTGPSDSALKYLGIAEQNDSIARMDQAKDHLLQQELKDAFKEMELQTQKKHRTALTYWGIAAALLFVSSVFFVFKYYNSRRKLQMTHLEALRNKLDAEKLALDKELLSNQLESKDKQIATSVMYQLQKNELIQGVTQKLLLFAKEKKADAGETIQSIIKDLEKATDHTIWEEFEMRFQEVHHSFYDKLQQQFPDLSPNERRLCAFLRLNMSSKEISTITGQSIHSIQVARTRLRKKLNLTHTDQGLIEYLASI